MGGGSFGYYEALLKQWIFSGKKDTTLQERYIDAVNLIQENLVRKSKPSGLTFIGKFTALRFRPTMHYTACAFPSLLALGWKNGMPESHLKLAEELVTTCHHMHWILKSGLPPFSAEFNMGPG